MVRPTHCRVSASQRHRDGVQPHRPDGGDGVAAEWSGQASATTQRTPNRPATGAPAITGTPQVGQISPWMRSTLPTKTAAKRNVQLPVAARPCRICRRDQLDLHAGRCRRGQAHSSPSVRETRKSITANFDDSRLPRVAERRTYNRASLQMKLSNRTQRQPPEVRHDQRRHQKRPNTRQFPPA